MKKVSNEESLYKDLINKIVKLLSKHAHKSFNYKQVAGMLGVEDKIGRQQINKILISLHKQRIILDLQKGKYKINQPSAKSLKGSYVVGKVEMKSSGKAFIICDDFEEDISVSPSNTNRALNGDVVKAFLFPKRKDRQPEGQIIEILTRAKNKFVGIVQISKNFAFMVSDQASMPFDIFIPIDKLNKAKDGQKVLVELTEWPAKAKNPIGKVIEVLGNPGDNDVEMNSILAEFDFPLLFPDNVIKEAEKINFTIPAKEITNRKDLRNVTTFTIDPIDAKDFDDALSVKKLTNNNWEVGVHIADVSYYVKQGNSIDEEAYSRGTSVYLVDRVIPMLPEHLSNNVCSLKPNEDKLCFSVIFEMDENAAIKSQWIGKTIINSNRRFDYDEVQKIIETSEGDYAEEVLTLHNLASVLRTQRMKNGSFAFETNEIKFNLDNNGKPLSVYVKQYLDSNKLVEDFMLLANRKVAEFIGKKTNPGHIKTFVYRVHDEPNPEKLSTFSTFVNKLGYKMNVNSKKEIAKSFEKLLVDINGKGEQNMVSTLAVRTMAKAYYTTVNIGHYGLAFDFYSHFTSPIRRYPDLMVHRLLEIYLNGKPSADAAVYEDKCKHSSEMEKKAADAERASVKYKQVEFLQDKVGQTFEGLISGVSKWGIYVEIIENKCEGMISLRDLKDDFYYLDEENYCVIGQMNSTIYKLGDKVTITVKRADLIKKQLDFAFVTV